MTLIAPAQERVIHLQSGVMNGKIQGDFLVVTDQRSIPHRKMING